MAAMPSFAVPKSPNLEGVRIDRGTPEGVAQRSVVMALTRAAQTLAITLDDPGSDVAQWSAMTSSRPTSDTSCRGKLVGRLYVGFFEGLRRPSRSAARNN